MKQTILTAILSAALTASIFCTFRPSPQDGVVTLPQPFDIHPGDSLDVCRFVCTDSYRSITGALHIDISYIQMGEENAFYQMKLSRKEVAYGHLVSQDSEMGEVLNFGSPEHQDPIRFCESPGRTYIVLDGDTVELSAMGTKFYY